MIEGTIHQVKMVNLKKRLKCKQDEPGLATLGTCYWRNFRKRHSHVLDADTDVSQALCRKEWSTYQHFEKMYTLVYAVMEEAEILSKLDHPVWMNVANDQVEMEEEVVGQKVTHIVKHPQYMMFVDEVGNNTNMKYDGNIGGDKLLKGKGNKARILTATYDQNFTVLEFTAGTCEAFLCCIIFSRNELSYEQRLGVYI